MTSSAITPEGSFHKSRGDNVVGAVEEVLCGCVLRRGHIYSGDGWELALTLFMYDLRKDDLFVLNCARVRQLRRGSVLQSC